MLLASSRFRKRLSSVCRSPSRYQGKAASSGHQPGITGSILDADALTRIGLAVDHTISCARQLLWRHLMKHPEFYSRHQGDAWELALEMGPASPDDAIRVAGNHGLGILSRVVKTEGGGKGGAKLLLELPDGRRVETVIVVAKRWSTSSVPTVCVSSQAGCAMACSFCDTGLLVGSGKLLGLPGWSILEQVFYAEAFIRRDAPHKINSPMNVVFMGMGEPLLNYANVLDALGVLSREPMHRPVTLSTVGVSPRIATLAVDAPRSTQLALSLHAPTQVLREKLLPRAARAWPLPGLLEACVRFERDTGNGTLLEYILLRGVNDEENHANELATLIHSSGLNCAGVNLIPYNPTSAGALAGFETPSDARCKAFRRSLRQAGVANVTIRFSTKLGRGFAGACGQLGLREAKNVLSSRQ